MPRRVRNTQSTDHDVVPHTKYKPKAQLPSLYNTLAPPASYQPLLLDSITNPGPNLPTDIDIDDPIAFFRLFFTDHVIQHLVECTNLQAERERERLGERPRQRPWSPVTQANMETYLGACKRA